MAVARPQENREGMTKIMQVKRIAVVGAGMMGNQIAKLLARVGGYETIVVDISNEIVERGLRAIDSRLENFFVAKGKMTADVKKQVVYRIQGSNSLETAVRDVDIVIEAVLENMNIKKRLRSIRCSRFRCPIPGSIAARRFMHRTTGAYPSGV